MMGSPLYTSLWGCHCIFSSLSASSVFTSLIPLLVLCFFPAFSTALPYTPGYEEYNLNQNASAESPFHYWGEWSNHTYHPSPKNWRMPFYTMFLDRFVNGDPSNDNANGTLYEHDSTSTNLRHGGDIMGLVDSLDYLQGMGIRTIYIAGTPFINLPAGADAYSPLDLTLLDAHFGTIDQWREAITEIHARGMYIVLENTVSTLGPLLGYKGNLVKAAPFSSHEHEVLWKSERQYSDFGFTNRDFTAKCSYPTYYNNEGRPYPSNDRNLGCYSGDFEQHGSSDAFENTPNWARSMTDFASVQDRLRDWKPDVMARISRFTCILVSMLDIDGFRVDKATQISVDGLVNWAEATRECARGLGKANFFISGEVTANHALGAVYMGKGRTPDQYNEHIHPMSLSRNVWKQHYIRNGYGLEANAFHYTIHRKLARFLGLDPSHGSDEEDKGSQSETVVPSLSPVDQNETFPADLDSDFMNIWKHMMRSDDFVNPNTGEFDPRNMYGVSNQDVFRWPGLQNGLERQMLAQFITAFVLPGIPLMLWGEEQGFYVIDSTAKNYNFGRQAMSSSPAWQMHGCYHLGVSTYRKFPLEKALSGCHDDWNSRDHRDPTAPIRLISKHMFALQEKIPSLRDGFDIQPVSLDTHNVFLPGSKNPYIETGLWSGVRRPLQGLQDFSDTEFGNQAVWLLYSNEHEAIEYNHGCASDRSIISPFPPGTIAKNLFSPYQEYKIEPLQNSNQIGAYGCLPQLSLPMFAFMALVPKEKFVRPTPFITHFSPGHDARILSSGDGPESIDIELRFSVEMNCESVSKSILIQSQTENDAVASIKGDSIQCGIVEAKQRNPLTLAPQPADGWAFTATLQNVYAGIHRLTVDNASSTANSSLTMAKDHFLLRVGKADNPVVFQSANYTQDLLHKSSDDSLFISHKASGANSFRYSMDWGVHYSDWQPYVGGKTQVNMSAVDASKGPKGKHVILEYWSKLAGSSSHVQHSDLTTTIETQPSKRFPHIYPQGRFNKFGYDGYFGSSGMEQQHDGTWTYAFMDEWPSSFVLNVLGLDKKGKPDRNVVFGDHNKDGVLDRIPPESFATNVIKIKDGPKAPYLAWQLEINDGTLRYDLKPIGSRSFQMRVFFTLLFMPAVLAIFAAFTFKRMFYQINLHGLEQQAPSSPIRTLITTLKEVSAAVGGRGRTSPQTEISRMTLNDELNFKHARKTVLIATLEYSIPRWNIEVKIGGLGVIAKLFANSFPDDNIIWVVPKLDGIDYPACEAADPINIVICGNYFAIQVSHLRVDNITYVFLEAPLFQAQSKSRPYPIRADDLESAVFYSAWNQAIAKVIGRFPVDIYHINDFHGALAPIYRLPLKIPICLTLHNADFQGQWPLRNAAETEEVCSIFNISPEACLEYVKCGSAFNLLHAASSYIRQYQDGYGVVGVSKDYGERSRARYPIFWGLSQIDGLPNPDPSDTAPIHEQSPKEKALEVTTTVSTLSNPHDRSAAKEKLQLWAGLETNPDAEVLTFVGRWSSQKGIDIIADLAPVLLNDYPAVQIIAIGPIVDLLGRFSALKFERLKHLYPGRVFFKTEFVAIPEFMHTGADFVLIPSRDEPFGLVQVEFGRKGALCIGSRIGGLGDMPGWWYSIESSTTAHLISQFEKACRAALRSGPQMRSALRAQGQSKRFPVRSWSSKVDYFRATAIARFNECSEKQDEYREADKKELETPTLPTFSSWPTRADKLKKDDQPRHHASGLSSPRWYEGYKPTDLSLPNVARLRDEFLLQTVEDVFTDEDGTYRDIFQQDLMQLTVASSTEGLSVEAYLTRCQKRWFNDCYNHKMGLFPGSYKAYLFRLCIDIVRPRDIQSPVMVEPINSEKQDLWKVKIVESPLSQLLLYKVGDWPIYTILLALGQILGGESCRISILSDPYDLSAWRLYSLAATYCVSTVIWWRIYRHAEVIWVLCPPFLLYGAAFFFMGLAEISVFSGYRSLISNVAAFLYTGAASSTSFFLTENFGHEVGCQVSDWIFRACMIHGVQQIYVAGLWYVGSQPPSVELSHLSLDGSHLKWWLPLITIPLGIFLALVGLALFKGLPTCYRTLPPSMPAFSASFKGRSTVFWFLFMIVIQNFFLSPVHGSNWSFLWNSTAISTLQTTMLILVFLTVVWGTLMLLFSKTSRNHSWVLPIIAMGLGAPRWCQILWATSRVGAFLPWMGGSSVLSSFVTRGLWLWLGLLDNVQGLGLGIVLLQTLTRHHNTFVLACAQAIGSIAIIMGKALGPSPGSIFPNLSGIEGTGHLLEFVGPWFFPIFILQASVCAMFFLGFRREQLWRP